MICFDSTYEFVWQEARTHPLHINRSVHTYLLIALYNEIVKTLLVVNTLDIL